MADLTERVMGLLEDRGVQSALCSSSSVAERGIEPYFFALRGAETGYEVSPVFEGGEIRIDVPMDTFLRWVTGCPIEVDLDNLILNIDDHGAAEMESKVLRFELMYHQHPNNFMHPSAEDLGLIDTQFSNYQLAGLNGPIQFIGSGTNPLNLLIIEQIRPINSESFVNIVDDVEKNTFLEVFPRFLAGCGMSQNSMQDLIQKVRENHINDFRKITLAHSEDSAYRAARQSFADQAQHGGFATFPEYPKIVLDTVRGLGSYNVALASFDVKTKALNLKTGLKI